MVKIDGLVSLAGFLLGFLALASVDQCLAKSYGFKLDQIVVLPICWHELAVADKKWVVTGLALLMADEVLLNGSGQITVLKVAIWP